MFQIFTPIIKKGLSSTLASVLLVTSVPLAASKAVAGPVCSDTVAANSGRDPNCAARVIGSQTVTYPRSVWREIAKVSTSPSGETEVSSAWLAGDLRNTLADKNATTLGLEAKDVVSMITMMPTNLPYVFARYNPLTGTLRVDLMKVEHTIVNGGKVTGLYASTFTPQHGNYWKASRQYISPDNFESGTVPGVNPFYKFQDGSSDLFKNVPQEATQVIVGHAMRYAGAPMAIKLVHIPNVTTTVRKHGGKLRKKITTTWWGHVKPAWWLAYPTTLLDRDSSVETRAYCVHSPTEGTCPRYELATSGVAFEEFKGGMLSSHEEKHQLRTKTKKGWTLLGMILVFSVISFAGFALMSAVAPATFASFSSAIAGLTGFGAVGGVAAIGSMGLQLTLALTGVAVFGGANLGGVYSFDERLLLLGVLTIKNTAAPTWGRLDQDTRSLSTRYIEPYTTADFIIGQNTAVAWKQTVTGTCAISGSIESCGTSTAVSGVVPRTNTRDASYVPAVKTQQNLSSPHRVNDHKGGGGHKQILRR